VLINLLVAIVGRRLVVKAKQADLVEPCSAMNMIPTIAVNDKDMQGEGIAGLV
jgi:hypothetical protein